MILISACLAGTDCKYNGKNNLVEEARELVRQRKAVPVCPETAGGLPIPRWPAEIIGDRVINDHGEDVTSCYMDGAAQCLQVCLKNACRIAVLKSNSPSCGPHSVYDGTFSHTVVTDRCGIFAQMLKDNGVECIDEAEFRERADEFV